MKVTIASRPRPPRPGTGRRKQAAPRKNSHWFRTTILAGYVTAVAWTTLVHANEYAAPESTAPAPVAPLAVEPMPALRGRLTVRQYVQNKARAAGVDPRIAEWIVTHESQHRPDATGDGGESRGLWQINKDWHPEVSDACAYDVPCSTRWSLERIRSGYAEEWSTWKYCRAWFDDCPF